MYTHTHTRTNVHTRIRVYNSSIHLSPEFVYAFSAKYARVFNRLLGGATREEENIARLPATFCLYLKRFFFFRFFGFRRLGQVSGSVSDARV